MLTLTYRHRTAIIALLCAVIFVVFPLFKAPHSTKSIVGILFVGGTLATLAYASIVELVNARTSPAAIAIFFLAVVIQTMGAAILLTSSHVGALYWDTHHVLELTQEQIFSDWRSFLFEMLSAYLLLIYRHVYTVPIVGAFLCSVALSIPILWGNSRRAIAVAFTATLIYLTPWFLSQSVEFFTDSFFAAFTVLSCYALLQFMSRSNTDGKRLASIGAIFVTCALYATLLRHNGAVNAVIFAVVAIVASSNRKRSAVLIGSMAALLFVHGAIKESNLYPEAHADSSATNRNFQTVALLLNPWGALLTSPNSYRTPSKDFDMKVLSEFIDPSFVTTHYTPTSSIPLWEKFASPWRTIDDEKTKGFVKLSAIRFAENIQIITKDRFSMFWGSIKNPQATPNFEKICALGTASTCPSAGQLQPIYTGQVERYVRKWPTYTDALTNEYGKPSKYTIVLIASMLWLGVGLVIRPTRQRTLFGVLGIFTVAALAATVPTPEVRYWFVILMLAAASFISEVAAGLKTGIDGPPNEFSA